MSDYIWTKSHTGATLITYAADKTLIEFWLDDADGEIVPGFIVTPRMGASYYSDEPECWPVIEQYVPRAEWPEPMYVGEDGPKERTPDAMITAAIETYKGEVMADPDFILDHFPTRDEIAKFEGPATRAFVDAGLDSAHPSQLALAAAYAYAGGDDEAGVIVDAAGYTLATTLPQIDQGRTVYVVIDGLGVAADTVGKRVDDVLADCEQAAGVPVAHIKLSEVLSREA